MARKFHTKEQINEWLLNDGRGIVLVGEYTSNRTKTSFRCEYGHEWLSTTDRIKSGCGCPYCSGLKKPTTEEFREWLRIDNRGITLVGNYHNKRTKTLFQCKNGHQWLTTPDHIKAGRGCPKCSVRTISTVSSEWLHTLGISIREFQISKKRRFLVDGYDPKTNTVYEFYGDFWHGNPAKFNPSDINAVTKKTFGEMYQETLQKENFIKSQGYNLVTMWESEFIHSLLPVKLSRNRTNLGNRKL
jgi:Zn finger protein HypA/HybF involved in hydrogenase expression